MTATEVRSDRYGLPTKKGTKGICLCKQETHVEDSSRTVVNSIQLPKTGLILKAPLMLRQNSQPRLAESATWERLFPAPKKFHHSRDFKKRTTGGKYSGSTSLLLNLIPVPFLLGPSYPNCDLFSWTRKFSVEVPSSTNASSGVDRLPFSKREPSPW